MPRRGSDGGAMSLEMVLMTPIFIAFIAFLAYGGRIVDARSELDSAARDAARAGSLGRTLDQAKTLARKAGADSLNGSWCKQPTYVFTPDPAFQAGATFKVRISCAVTFGDLTDFTGKLTLKGAAAAPIDQYTYRG